MQIGRLALLAFGLNQVTEVSATGGVVQRNLSGHA
jgi:hypothetical protein